MGKRPEIQARAEVTKELVAQTPQKGPQKPFNNDIRGVETSVELQPKPSRY